MIYQINDLSNELSSNPRLFADDSSIFGCSGYEFISQRFE